MRLFLIMAGIIFLVSAFYCLYRLYKKNRQLKERLEALQENVNLINQYAENVLAVKADRKETDTKIEEAENDEEIIDIANGIIRINNLRVQNNKN